MLNHSTTHFYKINSIHRQWKTSESDIEIWVFSRQQSTPRLSRGMCLLSVSKRMSTMCDRRKSLFFHKKLDRQHCSCSPNSWIEWVLYTSLNGSKVLNYPVFGFRAFKLADDNLGALFCGWTRNFSLKLPRSYLVGGVRSREAPRLWFANHMNEKVY